MTRKRFNVVTIAAMIAILALGGLGLGYAAWQDTLTVDVTASTGTLEVQFQSGPITVTEYVDNNVAAGESVANCTASATQNVLDIDVTNTYPGYECVIPVTIQNTGSLPAKLVSMVPSVNPPTGVVYDAGTCDDIGSSIPATSSITCQVNVGLDENAPASLQGQNISPEYTLTYETP